MGLTNLYQRWLKMIVLKILRASFNEENRATSNLENIRNYLCLCYYHDFKKKLS